MMAEYITHSGSDLLVVNAARVSFDKESKGEWSHAQGEEPELVPTDADVKLINYLAKHNHFTPFAHPQITLRMKAPIFVRTQCFKHKVGMTENEVSRRYVDDEPEFFIPSEWRGRPTEGAKQGSTGVVDKLYQYTDDSGHTVHCHPNSKYKMLLDLVEEVYSEFIVEGIAPEQARMVLPQSMYTQWFWTGSLSAYARFCRLRLDPHAQKEIQDLAQMVSDIIEPLYPYSWEALRGN